MNKGTPSQLGRTAAELLHNRLAEAGMGELYSRILRTMPTEIQEAQDASMLPMFRETASQYAMRFACARLAIKAATVFTKRPWREFTEGVVGYASGSMGDPIGGVKFHIH